ncbi:MAG: UDP-3-O-(3-hydroxymyristoyl)glucosamine N-acyltransferase [Longimicrobiales bacterium]
MTNDHPSRADGVSLDAGEVCHVVEGRLIGDPSRRVRGVAPIDEATDDELGFLASRRYLERLPETRAGVLLVASELEAEVSAAPYEPAAQIVVEDPHAVLPDLLRRFYPQVPVEPGVHPTAVLGSGVSLGEEVRVDPYAVVEDGATLGDRVRIGAHAVVGRGSRVGQDTVLHPHVVLYPGSTVGERVILHSGVRIGVDGFGYATVKGEHRKIPQVGGCTVEDDVEIGANTTVDRGSIGTTRIGRGVKMDNLIHLGHNVEVGEASMLVAQVGIAGSTRVGKGVLCGGQAGLNGHIEIGDGARIGAQAGVIGDIEPGETVSGYPARSHREYLRAMAMVFKLPDLMRRVRDLERREEEKEGG